MALAQPFASSPASAATGTGRIRRRTVYYLSGFDPQGPGHYHALYKEEGSKQAQVSGYRLEVGDRRRLQPSISTWDVRFQSKADEACDTRVLFLRWDDIVRRHWPRSRWTVARITLMSTWRMLRNGSLWRTLQTSWPAFLALVLPSLRLLGLLVAGGSLGLFLLWQSRDAPLPGVLAGLLLGLGALWALAHGLERLAQGNWLMRSARVILMQARGETPDLDERMAQFAAHLCRTLQEWEDDEVLVVGHSSGAMLAVSVVAQALRALPSGSPHIDRLGLLTLGECIPVLSYQPEALRFRADLQSLRSASQLRWLDVTAPPDACCFALVDPTAVCLDGKDSALGEASGRGPKRVSARFMQMFGSERYRQLRRDKHRCHFQYLMASELPTDYDYFRITAGVQAFAERYRQQTDITNFRQFQRFGNPAR